MCKKALTNITDFNNKWISGADLQSFKDNHISQKLVACNVDLSVIWHTQV